MTFARIRWCSLAWAYDKDKSAFLDRYISPADDTHYAKAVALLRCAGTRAAFRPRRRRMLGDATGAVDANPGSRSVSRHRPRRENTKRYQTDAQGRGDRRPCP